MTKYFKHVVLSYVTDRYSGVTQRLIFVYFQFPFSENVVYNQYQNYKPNWQSTQWGNLLFNNESFPILCPEMQASQY